MSLLNFEKINLDEGAVNALGNFFQRSAIIILLLLIICGGGYWIYNQEKDNQNLKQANEGLENKMLDLKKDLQIAKSEKEKFEKEAQSYKDLIVSIKKSLETISVETNSKSEITLEIEEKEKEIAQIQNNYTREIGNLKRDYDVLASQLENERKNSESLKKGQETMFQTNRELEQRIDSIRIKYDSIFNELRDEKDKTKELAAELDKNKIKEIDANLTLDPLSNGWVDQDYEIKRTKKAAKTKQVRVNFHLSRELRANDNLTIKLSNISWKGTEIIDKNEVKNNNGYVDFVVGKKSLSKGLLTARLYNNNTLISTTGINLK